MSGRVVVVGLGPAGTRFMLPDAHAAFEDAPRRFVRTARHPAVDELRAAGVELASFDAVYDAAASIDDVYRDIVEQLVAAANEHGTVAYGVPGSPLVAERTVELLDDAAREGRIEGAILEQALQDFGTDPATPAPWQQ